MNGKKIIFWVVVAGVLAAGGYFGYKFLFNKNAETGIPDDGTTPDDGIIPDDGGVTPEEETRASNYYKIIAKNGIAIVRQYPNDSSSIVRSIKNGSAIGLVKKSEYDSATDYVKILLAPICGQGRQGGYYVAYTKKNNIQTYAQMSNMGTPVCVPASTQTTITNFNINNLPQANVTVAGKN